MSDAPVLRIAIPGLARAAVQVVEQGDAPRLPAGEWLLARGRRIALDVDRWREWVLEGSSPGPDVLARFPAGPCAALAMHGMQSSGTWARAEPVHLLTALDHLQLAAPVPLPLDAADSAELLASLNDHLAGSGFVLDALADGGWLCECPRDLEFKAIEPWSAVGQNLRELLPTGRDAGNVRALVNELQMLLHEHPVNERRLARGQLPVNSIWLWGAGATSPPLGTATGALLTNDPWLAALWRLHDGQALSLDELAGTLDHCTAGVRVAVTPGLDGRSASEELQWAEHVLFAPARAALVAGRVKRIALLIGRSVFEVSAGARWAFWRRARPLLEVLA